MATATFTVNNTFTQTNALQASQSTPVNLPSLVETAATQYVESTATLPALGAGYVVPVGLNWTSVYQITIVNTDATKYCAVILRDNGGTERIRIILKPNGGTFATSVGPLGPTSIFAPTNVGLRHVDSTGTPDGNIGGSVYMYTTGA